MILPFDLTTDNSFVLKDNVRYINVHKGADIIKLNTKSCLPMKSSALACFPKGLRDPLRKKDDTLKIVYLANKSQELSPGFRILLKTLPGQQYQMQIRGILNKGDQAFLYIESRNPTERLIPREKLVSGLPFDNIIVFKAQSEITYVGIYFFSNQKEYSLEISDITIKKDNKNPINNKKDIEKIKSMNFNSRQIQNLLQDSDSDSDSDYDERGLDWNNKGKGGCEKECWEEWLKCCQKNKECQCVDIKKPVSIKNVPGQALCIKTNEDQPIGITGDIGITGPVCIKNVPGQSLCIKTNEDQPIGITGDIGITGPVCIKNVPGQSLCIKTNEDQPIGITGDIGITGPVCIKNVPGQSLCIKTNEGEPIGITGDIGITGPVCIKTNEGEPIDVSIQGPVCTFTKPTCSPNDKPGVLPNGLDEDLLYLVKDGQPIANFKDCATPVLCAATNEIVCISKIVAIVNFITDFREQDSSLNLNPGKLEITCNDKPAKDPEMDCPPNCKNDCSDPEDCTSDSSEIVMAVEKISDWINLAGKPDITQYDDFDQSFGVVQTYEFTYSFDERNCCKLTLPPGGALELRWTINQGTLSCPFYENLRDYGLKIFYCRQKVFCDFPKPPAPDLEILRCKPIERTLKSTPTDALIIPQSIGWKIELKTNVPTRFEAVTCAATKFGGFTKASDNPSDKSDVYATEAVVELNDFPCNPLQSIYTYTITVTDLEGNTQTCCGCLEINCLNNPINISNVILNDVGGNITWEVEWENASIDGSVGPGTGNILIFPFSEASGSGCDQIMVGGPGTFTVPNTSQFDVPINGGFVSNTDYFVETRATNSTSEGIIETQIVGPYQFFPA